jgi:hypothetical protein
MQELITLILIFQKTKFKSSGMLSILLESGSQMERLYEAIANGTVVTDEDAKKIFPEFKKDPNKLHTVKSKLKDRLNDSILLLDFKESAFSDRQKAFFECSKKWAASMILLSKNARQNGISLLEHLLKHTLRFEFTELTLDILRTLRLYYGVLEGNQKKFDEIEAQLDRYESVWMMERRVESNYAELVTRYVRSKSDKNAVSDKAREYFEKVKGYLDECDTFKVHLFGRLSELLIYDSINDYSNTAKRCEDALAFFGAKDYNSGIALQVFNYNLFICYLNLRDYEKCRKLADKNKELFEEGTYNWFKLMELYFLNSLHSGKYMEALHIYEQAATHAGFADQPVQITELWKIFEAYIYLLSKSGRLHAPALEAKFRVGRFLNEVQVFSKDKGGMNIPILVIQFLLELQDGKHDLLTDKVENLAKYRSRYLNENEAARSHRFFKMLEQIPKGNFKYQEVEKRTERLLEQLNDVPLEAANQNYEIEVIPYQLLWDITLEMIGKTIETVSVVEKTPGLSKTPPSMRMFHA